MLEPGGDGPGRHDQGCHLRAAEVLVATNSYTGPVTPNLQRRVIPVASQIIVTEPLDEDVAKG